MEPEDPSKPLADSRVLLGRPLQQGSEAALLLYPLGSEYLALF